MKCTNTTTSANVSNLVCDISKGDMVLAKGGEHGLALLFLGKVVIEIDTSANAVINVSAFSTIGEKLEHASMSMRVIKPTVPILVPER